MKKDRLYIISGRAGTGKKTLLGKILSRIPTFRVVKFYTTDPTLLNNDQYIYISPEKAADIEDKIVDRMVGGYEFFTRPKHLQEGDICILDPEGIEEVSDRMPDIALMLLYVTAGYREIKEHVVKGAADIKKAEREFLEKAKAEHERYQALEDAIASKSGYKKIVRPHYYIQNDYNDASLDKYVKDLIRMEHRVRNTYAIIQTLKSAGLLRMREGKVIQIPDFNAGVYDETHFSDIQLAYYMIWNASEAGQFIIQVYFGLEEIDLTKVAPTNTKVSYTYCKNTSDKTPCSIIVEGTFSTFMIETIKSRLSNGRYEGICFETTMHAPTTDMTAYELYKHFVEPKV